METKRKKCKVIMLPTTTEPYTMPYSDNIPTSNIIKGLTDGVNYSRGIWYKENYSINNYSKQMYQHLYIISDDEIKEGDWVYWTDPEGLTSDINQVVSIEGIIVLLSYPNHSETECFIDECNKIIATTDKSLMDRKPPMSYLPQPSKAFIEKYCKVGGIDEVMVEYEGYYPKVDNEEYSYIVNTLGIPFEDYKQPLEYKLKVNSHNEITIHSIKNSRTKEELDIITIDLLARLGLAINKTKTGELRNLLCDLNIVLQTLKL